MYSNSLENKLNQTKEELKCLYRDWGFAARRLDSYLEWLGAKDKNDEPVRELFDSLAVEFEEAAAAAEKRIGDKYEERRVLRCQISEVGVGF